jgi:glycosyltransferase involved in cell wall biosynthesis
MISVVVPSFNAGRWVAASLDSILAQTVPPGEVVVVDDGSTDDTPQILAAYGDRVRVVRAAHGGLAAARNLGLAVVTGDWIAFQDADDVARPDRLAVLQGYLNEVPASDGVFADGERLDDGEHLVPRARVTGIAGRRLTAADLFAGFPAYYQSALVARDSLAAAGPFDPSYRIHPDHDHAFRLFARARIGYLDRVVFGYRRHGDSITADHLGARRELVDTLERLQREDAAAVETIGRRRLEGALARHYARIGRTLLRQGEPGAAREALDRALRLRPLHPGHRWRRWRAGG